MAVSWSTPRPSDISLRDLRTVSASRNTSIRGSKSAAPIRTASARPLRVTISGRCVSFTLAKHDARLFRYSEKGIMSSVRRGRRHDDVRVCMECFSLDSCCVLYKKMFRSSTATQASGQGQGDCNAAGRGLPALPSWRCVLPAREREVAWPGWPTICKLWASSELCALHHGAATDLAALRTASAVRAFTPAASAISTADAFAMP